MQLMDSDNLEARYLAAKWYEKSDKKMARSYLFLAAQGGLGKAQAEIGRSVFFKESSTFSKRIAYEMLLPHMCQE